VHVEGEQEDVQVEERQVQGQAVQVVRHVGRLLDDGQAHVQGEQDDMLLEDREKHVQVQEVLKQV
jgi:hypothetical protein